MRIEGPGRTGAAAANGSVRRAREGGFFSLPETADAPQTAHTAATAAAQSLEALLLVQEIDPRERRRKAVERGRKSLDLLDELKLALMSGSDVGPALTRLEKTASALGETSGEPGLDGLIEAIDLRVAVELAKHRRGPR